MVVLVKVKNLKKKHTTNVIKSVKEDDGGRDEVRRAEKEKEGRRRWKR